MLKHNLLKIYLVLGVGLLVVMLGLPSVPVARALGNPITITVNTLDDVVDPSDDQCSLREAIVAANTNRRSGPPILREECTAGQNWSWGVDQIFFSVSGIIVVDPYSILGPLPDLYEGKTHIDGWSGMGPGTLPVVTLDGSQLDSGGNGLTLTSLANEVRGLAIINFINGSGISISGQYGNVNMVYGNWIGVDTQSNAQPNKIGVTIDSGTQYNRIEENVISGNTKAGVKIGGTFNMVTGNMIGVDESGELAIPNKYGVWLLSGADSNTIGIDPVSLAKINTISGNKIAGVRVDSALNIVGGNVIGLNTSGTRAIPNGNGVKLTNTSADNTIGSLAQGYMRNVISGNSGSGLHIDGTDNYVSGGNFIGTDITGNVAIGNELGVFVTGSNHRIDSSSDVGFKMYNVISGNKSSGIKVESAENTVIAGNIVGLDESGFSPIPNSEHGIDISDINTTNTRIGSNLDLVNDDQERNVISGNGKDGIRTEGEDTVVRCNLIGTSADGTVPLGNGDDGIQVLQNADGFYRIENNLIAHNPVGIRYASSTFDYGISANRIKGNGTGFLNKSGQTINLTHNGWGHPNGTSAGNPACPNTFINGSGDSVACSGPGSDTFSMFATTPPNLCGVIP